MSYRCKLIVFIFLLQYIMSYCVKCKSKTTTVNALQLTTRNNRRMTKGECAVCQKPKTAFIGASFSFNSFVNNLPIELHQFAEKGEYVPGGSFNNQ